jgi:dTMP kinase
MGNPITHHPSPITSPAFITFEGIDGCGKSTQLELLREHLATRGMRVLTTREPGGTVLAEQVREYILNSPEKLSPRAELLLFAAARAQHVEEKIKPALQNGTVVLCDRFADSTLAYQGGGLGFDFQTIAQLNTFATGGLEPGITFLFDVEPEVGAQRRAASRGEDRIEARGLEFQSKVRRAFLEIAQQNSQRITVLDATQSIEELHAQVLRVLQSFKI